jgi:hypothetical protein
MLCQQLHGHVSFTPAARGRDEPEPKREAVLCCAKALWVLTCFGSVSEGILARKSALEPSLQGLRGGMRGASRVDVCNERARCDCACLKLSF